jgi:hypothetical protein
VLLRKGLVDGEIQKLVVIVTSAVTKGLSSLRFSTWQDQVCDVQADDAELPIFLIPLDLHKHQTKPRHLRLQRCQ